MIKFKIKNESGFASVIAIIMVAMLTLLGLAVLSGSDDELSIASNELQEMKAFYASESGLDMAAAALHKEFDSTGSPPVTMLTGELDFNNCAVVYETTDDGPTAHEILTNGALVGLHALVKSFTMSSTATNVEEKSKVTLTQSFKSALIPIFQFAVFYEDILQTTPEYQMTIDGRVHCNDDMWLNPNSGLYFTSKVTCAGSINHGLENGTMSGATNDVYFKDSGGNYSNWRNGSSFLDAGYSNWYDSAISRWSGNVQDQAMGQDKLNVPLSSGDPHKLIERSTGNPDSYQNKAGFMVIDGVPLAKIGAVWQDVTGFIPVGTITNDVTSEFYDGHETKTVNNVQIDMGLLKSSGYFPANGVMYISDQRATSSSYMNGATLSNGTDIGNPITIVCENPLYIEGDYNTVNKQPSAVISDALTILSNDWAPTNKAKSTLNYDMRSVSSKTTVNTAILTGDLVPTSTNYGGGLENLPRFLEDWAGEELEIRGSIICLWKSQDATGTWKYEGSPGYYSAPTRDWGFDTNFNDPNNLPPESPCVRLFQRVGWQQQYVGYDG